MLYQSSPLSFESIAVIIALSLILLLFIGMIVGAIFLLAREDTSNPE